MFEGLSIWQEKFPEGGKASKEDKYFLEDYKYRQIQGTYPVIALSFAKVQEALRQIDEKNYKAALIAKGIPEERIRNYGFAFCGKKVLIGS